METRGNDRRLKITLWLCIACAAFSAAGLWTLAPMLRSFAVAQAEQTDLLNKVLRRIPAMTTFEQDVVNLANHTIHVSVTCRENERLEDCIQRFQDAVAAAAATST